MHRRKGQAPVGEMLALIIFISIIILAFVTINSEIMSKKPFESSLNAEAKNIYEKIEDTLSITVYKTPVFVKSQTSVEDASIYINFTPPQGTDLNTISMTDADGNPIPSQFDKDEGTVKWYSDLSGTAESNPPNTFYLIYVKGTDMSQFVYEGLET
ncbi:MAG: hypothetical protein U9P44_03665, partial [archaeon]|nr:hypothetical protein [archaeon]